MPSDPPRGYPLRRAFIRTPPSSNPGVAPGHKRNTTTSSLFRYRFQHPFCCKTKLGGHFKGGVVPLSFFKINVTGNIYKPERLVWPVNCSQNIVWNVQYALFQLGSWTSWCFISYYWRRYLVDVRSRTPIMAHLHSLFHLGVQIVKRSGQWRAS